MTEISEENALVEIAFASEVRELTEMFKKYPHLHGSEKFTKELIKARGNIERRQSVEFQENQKKTREWWDLHKMQWKFLPKEDK